jgi:hypothetical protein
MWRDVRIVVVITVLCALLIGGLWLLARDAPSAHQLDSVSMTTAAVSAEQGCTNFARFWTHDSGIAVPPDAIADLTNCRQDSEGEWFVPSGATDPRLTDEYRLSQSEQQQVAVLSAQLSDDLVALDETLPRSLQDSLGDNYVAENLPVFGHTARGRTDLSPKRARYIRITQAFLIDPERIVAADYVGWLMERRSEAVDAFETACFADPDTGYLVRACKGLREEFGARYIPLYWDLTDPQLIQEYLVDRVRSGEPLPGPTTDAIGTRRE